MGEQYVMEPKELTKDISMAYRVYDTYGVSTTLKAVGGGVGAKTGLYKIREATKKGYALAEEGDIINIQDSIIRRLTPIECERLQGFEDNWTEDLSDTQRYKCLGNAVTTNVVTVIVERLYSNI